MDVIKELKEEEIMTYAIERLFDNIEKQGMEKQRKKSEKEREEERKKSEEEKIEKALRKGYCRDNRGF